MLEEMLKHRELAARTCVEADRRQAEAHAAAAKSDLDKAWADEQLVAIDKDIHDLLERDGTHLIIEPDGTASTYHAVDRQPGWMKDHPKPGAARMMLTKPESRPESDPE